MASVKVRGSDDKTITPHDKSKYTISFSTDGSVSVRIDCNRGHGTWKSRRLKPVLLDTGVIVALLDRSERHHADCVQALEEVRVLLVTCEPVIAEASYLMRNLPGAPEAILQNVSDGAFQIPIQLSRCAAAIQHILRKYRDQHIELAGACLIHLASEFGTGDILTLDNDFKVYRWGANRLFSPVP